MHFHLMLWTTFVFATVEIVFSSKNNHGGKPVYTLQNDQWHYKEPIGRDKVKIHKIDSLGMVDKMQSHFEIPSSYIDPKVQIVVNGKVKKTYSAWKQVPIYDTLVALLKIIKFPVYQVEVVRKQKVSIINVTTKKSMNKCVNFMPYMQPSDSIKSWYCLDKGGVTVSEMMNMLNQIQMGDNQKLKVIMTSNENIEFNVQQNDQEKQHIMNQLTKMNAAPVTQ
eukprot:NODE_543_length_6231_cov_0.300718.p4 type:complete len:222 gc:universal NODE_543_length_6231_cov_0.300718:5141-5806(+)